MPPLDLASVRGRLPAYRRPAVGLALGGGGARGYAHIGVLKVLAREKVPVDLLAGTSMGGFIAAALAIGMTPAEMEAEALKMRTLSMVDLMPQPTGLMEGRKVRDYLQRIFGQRTFSDTFVPLRLVAVDLDSGEEVALSEGLLVDAIRATISVPGVFSPADWRGRRLVDGGLTNTVPADVVRAMGAEFLIAVDVGYTTFEPLAGETARRQLSLPGLVRLAPVAGILTRSLNIMQFEITRHRLAQAHPEVVIRPLIGAVNIEEFDRAAEVIPSGERAAAEVLPLLREAPRKRLFWGPAAAPSAPVLGSPQGAAPAPTAGS